ncbi:MAG: MAC/perforin domain-containing protein [Cyanobacteria bacterium J06632_22]
MIAPTTESQSISCTEDMLGKPPLNDNQIKAIQNFLGTGYRAYDYYADPSSITQSLFDFSEEQTLSTYADLLDSSGFSSRFFQGENQKDYFQNISISIGLSGKYEGFSGEVNRSFDWEKSTESHHQVFNYTDMIAQYRLTITENAPLIASVKADLEGNLHPTQLFDKYGTHYLHSVLIGGRVSLVSHYDTNSSSSTVSAKTVASAAFLELLRGETSTSAEIRQFAKAAVLNRKILINGGDPALAVSIRDAETGKMSESYAAWVSSLETQPSIADFVNDGLRPLYMLAESTERRAELKTAWEHYLKERNAYIVDAKTPEVVAKNATVQLQANDGRYIQEAHATLHYYYPKLSASKGDAMSFQLTGDGAPLTSGTNLSIKTTEKFKDTKWRHWSTHTYLGKFGNVTELYYWKEYGSKTNWIIEKADPISGPTIHYGDAVTIRNEHYANKYLQPGKDGYLMLKKEKYTFTFDKG